MAAGIFVGDSPREVLWRLLVVITIVLHHLLQINFTAVEFFFTAAAIMIASVAVQAWRVARVLPANGVAGITADGRRLAGCPVRFAMWLSAMLDTANQYLEVIVIGFFLGPAVAAFYFVATRITNVFSMIAASMTGYATSRISALYHTGARTSCRRPALARHHRRIARRRCVPGDRVRRKTAALVVRRSLRLVLSCAARALRGGVFSALAGPAAYLLLLTGNEGAYPRIMAVGLCARFALIAVLAPRFGLMGAAVAWSISAAGLSLALVIACYRLVRIDPSLAGTVWRLLRPTVRPTASGA